jgi:hypothetical protein
MSLESVLWAAESTIPDPTTSDRVTSARVTVAFKSESMGQEQ